VMCGRGEGDCVSRASVNVNELGWLTFTSGPTQQAEPNYRHATYRRAANAFLSTEPSGVNRNSKHVAHNRPPTGMKRAPI